jgi:toxin ParE1/3/4
MRVIYTRQAAADLRHVQDYIAEHDPKAAHRVTQLVRERVELLATRPRLGRPGRVADTRELVITGTPYIVPYRITRQAIHILAVIHGRRRWPDQL